MQRKYKNALCIARNAPTLGNMKKNLTDSTYSTHELDSQLLYSLRDFVLHYTVVNSRL